MEIEIAWQCLKSKELFPQGLQYQLFEQTEGTVGFCLCGKRRLHTELLLCHQVSRYTGWAKEEPSDFILSLVSRAYILLMALKQVKQNPIPIFFSYCQPDLSVRKEIKANATLFVHFYMCYGSAAAGNKKCHVAAPPPAGVRRRMERKRQKLVGRDKGSLTEQQTEGTRTTTIQIRGIHKTKQMATTEFPPEPPPLRPPKPQVSSRCPAPPHRNPA